MDARLLKHRYELQVRLSEDAHGESWRGQDRVADRPVVVRILKPGQRQTDAVVARWLGRLGERPPQPHPVLARRLDGGRDGDTAFYVREYIEGPTLERWRSESRSYPEVLERFAEVLRALADCHAAGSVHGYLHPGNIVLADDGPRFCDDDVAAAFRAAFGERTLRRRAAYLAPEVASGGHPGAASDVYSIGVALWECLTGGRSAGGTIERAAPSTVNRELPAGVDVIVEGMLRSDSDDRYPAAQAAEALTTLRSQAERRAERTPRGVRRERTRRRAEQARKPLPWPVVVILVFYRFLFILIGTVVVSGVTIGVGGLGVYRYVVESMPDEVIVPDVTGLSRDEARELLGNDFGLAFKVAIEQASRTVPQGCVIATNPEAGRRVKAGRVIETTLSTGPELVTVPRFVDTALPETQDRIRRLGLQIGHTQTVAHPTLPAGYIISQDPGPGRRVESGTKVHLKISSGPSDGRSVTPPTVAETAAERRSATVRIVVPSEPRYSVVRIVTRDDTGEKTVYREMHDAGEQVTVNVTGIGETVVEVYLNDIRVETKVL